MEGPQKESAQHYRLLLRLLCFALIRQQNYETDLLQVFGSSNAGLFRFLLSFVLIPSLILGEHPVPSWISGHGGLVCHVCWAVGSRRALL